jgi:hypothetical protein
LFVVFFFFLIMFTSHVEHCTSHEQLAKDESGSVFLRKLLHVATKRRAGLSSWHGSALVATGSSSLKVFHPNVNREL